MIILSEDEKQFIQENLDNAEQLLQAKHVNELLDVLDDLILEKGFIDYDDGGLNDFGRKAQRIYDSIYLNN